MTFPTDDLANRELSIEDLEAIAGAGLLGWIKSEASSVLHFFEGSGKAAIGLGEFLVGPPEAYKAMYHKLF